MTRGRILPLIAAAAMGAALALGARVVLTAPDTALPWSVSGGGGTSTSASASYRLGATAGQPAIGQSDSTGFRLGAGFWYGACADPDSDGATSCPPVDNCPSAANPGQQNNVHPGTPAGDHCEDPEPDGVLDISDNCPDTANSGQENADGDKWGDACETASCIAVYTLWVTPLGDEDCDGFTTAAENFMGTLPLVACAANNTADNEDPPDAWPFDFDDNQRAALADVLGYIPVFNSFDPNPPYDPRFDLTQSGGITLADVLSFIPVFNKVCIPP